MSKRNLLQANKMLNLATLSSFIGIVIFLVSGSVALECYVCDKQEDNNGKCVTTIKTCEYGEDVCQTEIAWGSTPYWQQGALKQYYVSKKCSTKDKCIAHRTANMAFCTHIWYQDWHCSDCCKGDRCNYYIFSGSDRTNSINNYLFLLTATIALVYTRM